MPYIRKEVRKALAGDQKPLFPGELNYTIIKLIVDWLGKDPGYGEYNTAIGVLEAAKLELYRRAVAPYEDTKIAENGDVF